MKKRSYCVIKGGLIEDERNGGRLWEINNMNDLMKYVRSLSHTDMFLVFVCGDKFMVDRYERKERIPAHIFNSADKVYTPHAYAA
jgi:hypothetical protein